jgi:hypothetical protein
MSNPETDISSEKEVNKEMLEKLSDVFKSHSDTYMTFTYYMTSINGACIGFTISITKSVSGGNDYLILVSMLLWFFSFLFFLTNIARQLSLSNSFSLYIITKIYKNKDVVNENKKAFQTQMSRLGKKELIPFILLILGINVFIVWYVLKIFNN